MGFGEVGAVATGTVVRFNGTNGYGFITPDDGGEDVFLHASLLSDRYKDAVPPGTRVDFQAVSSERGPKAVAVTVTGPAEAAGGSSAGESRRDDPDDQLCDVVSTSEFAQKITEVLIDVAPSITGAQISEIRRSLLAYGAGHGWIED